MRMVRPPLDLLMTSFPEGSVLFHNAFVTSALALHTPIAQSSSRP